MKIINGILRSKVTGGDDHDHVGGDGGQVDHGSLGGRTDDDHTIYALSDGSRAFTGEVLIDIDAPLDQWTEAFIIDIDQAGTLSASSLLYGVEAIIESNITNNGKSHASVALLGWATLAGGTALYLQGQASYAYVTGGTANTAHGIDAWCETDGGTITKGYGTSHWISNTSGTFITAYGTYSDIDGVIGTVYGTYTDMSDVTGTTWGIYCIGDQNNHLSGGLEVEGATRLGSATNNTGVDAAGTVSFAGTARIGWTKIAANGVTFADGPPSSGSALSAIQSHDGTLYTVDEDATNPGQNMVVDFTGVTAFNWVQIVAYYDGQASHHVEIQLEITPFNGSAWRSFGIMYPNGSHIENHSFFVPDDTDYINSGVVNIRFIHAESGNSNDDWVFDVVALYQ